MTKVVRIIVQDEEEADRNLDNELPEREIMFKMQDIAVDTFWKQAKKLKGFFERDE